MKQWILQVYRETGKLDARLFSLFLKPMRDLLHEAYSGKIGLFTLQHTSSGERTMRIDFQQRNVYVARL